MSAASLAVAPLTGGRPKYVLNALRGLYVELQIAASLHFWRRTIEQVHRGRSGLKLNLGCGPNVRKGWVNLDLFNRAAFRWDVRYGLPFEPGSCSFVYSEHLFEHLEYVDGIRFLQDCLRVLEPGGTVRIVVPDYIGFFQAYIQGNHGYFGPMDQGLPGELFRTEGLSQSDVTLVDYVNYAVFLQGEHKVVTDADKLRTLLERAGFHDVETTTPNPQVDSMAPYRAEYSLYVQARKPRRDLDPIST